MWNTTKSTYQTALFKFKEEHVHALHDGCMIVDVLGRIFIFVPALYKRGKFPLNFATLQKNCAHS